MHCLRRNVLLERQCVLGLQCQQLPVREFGRVHKLRAVLGGQPGHLPAVRPQLPDTLYIIPTFPMEDRTLHKDFLLVFLYFFDNPDTSKSPFSRSPRMQEEKAGQARSKLIDMLCMTSFAKRPLHIKAIEINSPR